MIPKWPGDRDRTGWFDRDIELTGEMHCVRGLSECAGLFVDDVLGIYQFNKVCGGDEIRPVAIPESEISDGGSVCCRNHRVGFIQVVPSSACIHTASYLETVQDMSWKLISLALVRTERGASNVPQP